MTKTAIPATPYREPTVEDLLPIVAARLKSGYELMGSKWENCEAEVIARQTICACNLNLKNHGEPLSWLSGSATTGRQMCGTNNARGLYMLIEDGMMVRESYEGSLTPPDTVSRDDKGRPEVVRCTIALLKYVDFFVPGKKKK